jgi:hypothetical protein
MSTDPATQDRMLKDLNAFVGEWSMQASLSPPVAPASSSVSDSPNRASDSPTGASDSPTGSLGPDAARASFEWILDGRFLLQRAEVPGVPSAPDVFAIIGPDLDGGGYLQHYFDSRGVVRTYAMTVSEGVWRLRRSSPDFSALDFSQRFAGTFDDEGTTIDGRWEISRDGSGWEPDFGLVYTKIA